MGLNTMNYPLHPEYQIQQAIEQASQIPPPRIKMVPVNHSWVQVKTPRKADPIPPHRTLWWRLDDLESRLEELEQQTKNAW